MGWIVGIVIDIASEERLCFGSYVNVIPPVRGVFLFCW